MAAARGANLFTVIAKLAGAREPPLDDAASGAGDRESGLCDRRQPVRDRSQISSYTGRSLSIVDQHGEVMTDAGSR
jgi:hypothetical protein